MNNIFSSQYSSSNPFGIGGKESSLSNLEDSLRDSYAKLEALKARQQQFNQSVQSQQQSSQYSTVFTDIQSELKDLSQDELTFIMSSPEYQTSSAKFQEDFSQFLISKFSNEYLSMGNSRPVEEMLYSIRKKKDDYKKKFSDDINEIRDQNKELLDRNNQLAESNQLLQTQLKEIQERLKGV